MLAEPGEGLVFGIGVDSSYLNVAVATTDAVKKCNCFVMP